ncbi:HAMP domain-containing protein [Streptomonospora sp. S1-112]|uniref:histidine kinase n=1 Tax=Streptomonospora mangrovi TaxID=2883123 RepID=A0A9X3NML4_9ACTN|nr:ATP-binding protein [Streptomonospora mangrovi]MDA0566267.1 HAMP domain-containing protein [Streptomonospora mangrovi]
MGRRREGARRRGAARRGSRVRGALRHSLLGRLLTTSVVVAVCSITATAWLAVQGTSESISVQQGQTLTADTRIHDELIAYAATHPEWRGVDAVLAGLAEDTGRRIALTTENRRLIADSAAGGTPLPTRTASVVDPLAVDLTLAAEDADRIDPRAVGPFALPRGERERLAHTAESGAECLRTRFGTAAEAGTAPSGRPVVTLSEGPVTEPEWVACELDGLEEPTDTERGALADLNRLIEACAAPHGLEVRARMDSATGVPTAAVEPTPPPEVGADGDGGGEGDGGGGDGGGEGDAEGGGSATADEARPPEAEAPAGGTPSDPPVAPSSGPEAVEEYPWPGADAPGASVEEPATQPEPPAAVVETPAAEPVPEPVPGAPVDPEAAPHDAAAQLDPRAADCLDSARRRQLDPYTAPAALLFIGDPEPQAVGGLELSREGLLRVSGVVLLVLLLTVGVSAGAAARLVRPVRDLTEAVRRMRAGEGSPRVPVRDSGEIGRLAEAFNEMSAHLERLEGQRRAMVSDVSHELRTPLANLRGWLEAAQDGVAELEPARTALLVEQTMLLQRIIDDLQDLALAEAGKLTLVPEPLDARDLVEQAVDGHRMAAASARVELVARTADEEVPVAADRVRMLQVLGNLLGNAVRHTPAGGRVTVRAHAEDGAAVIEVADTGDGISPAHLPNVFDRFWRADKSRSRQTGGSGLGLAIVRNLVELHGGTVTAASTPGEGAVFTLRLPRPEPEPPAATD